jgi:hypothetical protein
MNDWAPEDLTSIVDGLQRGEIVGPVPTLLARTDGVPLLYLGQIHSIAGEPEVGKGWIVQAETARLLPHHKVLYLDFEDTAASVLERLFALGATAEQITTNLAYVRPDVPPAPRTIPGLLAEGPFVLAVIDGLSEAYVLLGLDPYSNVDAAKFLAAVARPLADHGSRPGHPGRTSPPERDGRTGAPDPRARPGRPARLRRADDHQRQRRPQGRLRPLRRAAHLTPTRA